MKLAQQKPTGKHALEMTPMIDIVFQLLVFFVMTFRIATAEGDFNIKMPQVGEGGQAAIDVPLQVRLTADASGGLDAVYLNGVRFGQDWGALHSHLMAQYADPRGPSPNLRQELPVELQCDYGLRYEHAVAALTAVTGHRNADGTIIPLFEKLQFAPPR